MPKTLRLNIISLLGLLVIGVMGNTAQAATEAQQEPLILGFFPIISTVALFKRFTPLKDYLSEQLGRPVRLETAKDFPTFAQRTGDRRYDIVVTAPHFAIRAVDSGKYQIKATLLKDVQQLLVVHKNSPIQQIAELAGKRIATPPPRALMTMMGKTYLREHGLTDEREPSYLAFTSHNASNEALIAGQVDAAIASSNIIGKAKERGAPIRILSEGLKLPNMATMVATDLPPALAEQIEQAFVGMRDNAQGRDALKHMGFPGYRSVSITDYEPVRPYAYPLQSSHEDPAQLSQ